MQLIRQDTDYALRAMLHLAQMRDGEKLTARGLAASQQIPLSFCHKILRKLVAARLIESRTGRQGGFRLGRRPRTIRLLHIVNAVQGPVAVSPCMISLDACPRRPACPLSRRWRKLQGGVIRFLRTTTLADILDR